jgi:putative peptidoglycan lipid II flippase
MGYRGLALGTGLSATVNAGLLLYLLDRRLGGIDGARVLQALVKILIASAVMGVAAYATDAWLHGRFPAASFVAYLIRVCGGIGAGLGTLALSAWILRIEEFGQAISRVLSRVRPVR